MQKLLKDLIYDVYARSGKNLDRYKNTHRGEDCYIIGDGTSIKWFDLKAFNDKPVFALCYLFFHRNFSDIGRPIYVPFNSPFYFYSHYKMTIPPYARWKNNIQNRYRQFIKQYHDAQFFVNLSNYPVLQGKNVNYFFKSIPGSELSDRCMSQNLTPFEGGFRAAIIMAVFMGFKKIYLVGCDYTHKNARAKHWYEFGPGISIPDDGYNRDFLEIAEKYAEIITITWEGEGRYLPSIEYEKYTKQVPVYKENCDLIDMNDLFLLDTWPDYTIFPRVESLTESV